MAKILQAKRDFFVNGRLIRRGETFADQHPLVLSHADKFEPFIVDNAVEKATAAPGEKR